MKLATIICALLLGGCRIALWPLPPPKSKPTEPQLVVCEVKKPGDCE